jgi:hypothetical protein
MKDYPVSLRFSTATLLLSAVLLSCQGRAADLVSIPDDSFSPPVSAGGDSFLSGMSSDGRYVLFASSAKNLVKRTNGLSYSVPQPIAANAFVHDRQLGTTTLISADSGEVSHGSAFFRAFGHFNQRPIRIV